jgi:hypothetical protein
LKSLGVEYVGKITKKKMIRPSYDTDLTNYQWQILEPLVSQISFSGYFSTFGGAYHFRH